MMKFIMYKICLIFPLYVISIESKRILAVFPSPSISHQVVFRPVMEELAKRGHDVTVITTDPAFPKGHAPDNLTEIDVHDISYNTFGRLFSSKFKTGSAAALIKSALESIAVVFEEQIKSKEVQALINNNKNKFDLLIIEAVSRLSLSFSYLYKVPVIEFSSLGGQFDAYEALGAATQPFIYPLITQERIYNLTLWEKLSEIYNRYSCNYVYSQVEKTDDELLKRLFGPNIPVIKELKKNVHMAFLNVHPIWDSNRPVPPNVIYLGGLHQKPAKQLPKDIQSYLDHSTHGVIYMSFGTNVSPSALPPEKIEIFTKVFSQLPYDVLWKWDKEELPGHPRNVKISKWFPQSDLLRHPKIQLFITQGGLQSTDEAITAGVPLLCIPILWDQWYNAEQYVKHNIGIYFSLEALTEDKLKDTMNTLIDNKSYRDNMVKLRTIVQDQPQTPLERAVWWTEYVLRHGSAAHLRSPAANMHWTEYYELELVLSLLGILLIIIISVVSIIRYIILKLKKNFVKIKTT